MLQSLLMERFRLKYHRDSREGRVYILVKTNKPLKMTGAKGRTGSHGAAAPAVA